MLPVHPMHDAYHIPVLLHTSIDALHILPEGIYADATFGGGGHSREILKHLGEKGKLVAFDQDPDAVKNSPGDSRFLLIRENFRYIKKFLRAEGIKKIDGILADLGVSSYQFDEPERGFSIRFDAQLDMRMDQRQMLTAEKIINEYSRKELQEIFGRYGEVRNAKQLSETILAAREIKRITTTEEFRQVAEKVRKGEQHKYFAQVFQAIRIAVNDELGALQQLLESSAELLKPGGRLVIISYHSLEDKMVKNFMRTGNIEGEEKTDVMGRMLTPFRIITKKHIEPGEEEKKNNPRSRSARLRAAEKTEHDRSE